MKKRVITDQRYENYWKLTLEYTDYTEKRFNDVLTIIVDYIDQYINDEIGFTSAHYKKLQGIIEKVYPKKDSASTRKSINQFFKLGFINNYGKSYHHLTRNFLTETDSEQKRLLYSKILYENASFSRSCTNPSSVNEIKFLLKTLEECGNICKGELLALMYTDVESVSKGYLTKSELHFKHIKLLAGGADERKYNQCNYLFNLCKTLTDIYVKNGILSITPWKESEEEERRRVRDPYLQRLYKQELIKEHKRLYNVEQAACVLEGLRYPILIASHIKPYRVCNDKEAFDCNNGLLLSKNMDSLFDNGYITFDDDGKVITSSRLDKNVADYVKKFSLDAKVYNDSRKAFMKFHRENVFS